jgi:hypothetical protein
MKNVQMTVDGIIVTIQVDLSKEFGPSSFGRRASWTRPKGMSPGLIGKRRWG